MISVVQEKFPEATMMARRDFAHIQKKKLIENPYWFTDGAQEYHGIYGCIGWPQKMTEKADQRPGYAAIVAVIKDEKPAEEAIFKVVDEIECETATALVQKCVDMRSRWGFGVHPHLLRVFMGDFRQFENVTARYNSELVANGGTDREAFIVSHPDDYDNPRAFDMYLSWLRFVLGLGSKRLYLGDAGIIKNRIMSFLRDDPAIMAIGGLIHTIILRTPWMEQSEPSVFQLPDI